MHHGTCVHLPHGDVIECPRKFEFAREGSIVVHWLLLLLLFLHLLLLNGWRAMIIEEPVDACFLQDLATLFLLDG